MSNILFSLLLVFGSWNYTAPRKVRLLFAGDLMQHRQQLESAFRDSLTFNYSDCFELVKPLIESADISIGNLEVTLGSPPYTGYPRFSSPQEFAQAIQNAGFDLMLTANNHCLDRGRKGVVSTIRILDSLGIARCGTYLDQADRDSLYPLILEKNGIRIAFLNYTYGTNGINVPTPCIVNLIDTAIIKADIIKAYSKKPDCVIVCLHWGKEYKRQPSLEQRSLAQWLLAHGADHIIGSHPHTVQPMELILDSMRADNHLIAYSLGNFISNMSAEHTDNGATVSLSLVKIGTVTRLDSCGYNLVWTQNPAISKKENFRVIPAQYPAIDLLPASLTLMNKSISATRSLLRTHNSNVTELSDENER